MQNRSFNLIPLVIGLIAIAFMAARGCEEGPFGRHRVVNLSVKEEFQLGAQAYDKILRDERGNVVERGAIVDVVRRVGRRLASASTDKELRDKMGLKAMDFEWKFNVVESKQINAFCLPGGKVVVYTGILPVCRTEGGLATVMGHEIGHALARHGAERISQQQLVTIGQTAVAVSVSDMDPKKRAAVMGALGVGTQVGVILPFSRAHESEADHIGILLMARAGYDPSEAPEFWQRMDKATAGGKRQAEFLSTHPNPATRIADLRGWLPEAETFYQKVSKSERMPSARMPQQ